MSRSRGLISGVTPRTSSWRGRAARLPRLTAFSAGAALLLAACGDGGEQGANERRLASGGTAVVCQQTEPRGLNPFLSPDQATADLLPVLYTPLVRYGDDARIQPHLAASWVWDEEHRNLTLTLRDSVRWHDGTPLTSEDVAWTLRLAADTLHGYWNATDFSQVQEVTAPDPRTVLVSFKEPFAAGLEPFATLPILPRHILGRLGPEEFAQAAYHTSPVGSGPFRFVERRVDGSLVLERVPDFPEALGRASLNRLVLRVVPETPSMLVELQTGNVDACVAGATAAEDAQRIASIDVHAVEPAGTQVIPVAVDEAPFRDARVRRALSAALNRQELAAAMSPLARPARNFLPASNPFREDSIGLVDADPALAEALLDSAGWSRRDRQGIRLDAAGRPLQFTIVGPTPYRDLLTAVQGQLRRVGVDARIELLEGSTYIARIQDPETRPAAMALAFTPDKVVAYDPYPYLHSEGWSNLSSYHDPAVDSLVVALSSTIEDPVRARIYRELQRRVARDVPALYLMYTPRLLAVGPRLQGVRVNPSGPFASVSEWTVTSRR